jgi:adenylate cyclase
VATEIERRFLVDISLWKRSPFGENIWQAYLSLDIRRVVRIRLIAEVGIRFEKAFITIKGKNKKASRPEYEYRIPVKDAQEMLKMCIGLVVKKTRYTQEFEGKTWYIDVFHAENHGLVLAEIELESEDESFLLPDWVDQEVGDPKYANVSLAKNPYKNWTAGMPDTRKSLLSKMAHVMKKTFFPIRGS